MIDSLLELKRPSSCADCSLFDMIVENITQNDVFKDTLKEAFNSNKSLLTLEKFKKDV